MTIFRLFQMHAKRWLVSHRAAPRDDQVVAEHRDQHIDPEGNHDHDVHGQKFLYQMTPSPISWRLRIKMSPQSETSVILG